MTSLVSALDTTTPVQVGEKGHNEYGWSENMEEKILQLSFQLTRTNNSQVLKSLSNTYYSLLDYVFNGTKLISEEKMKYASILYRMMLHTRDMISGKGEYNLFYNLLTQWVILGEKNDVCLSLAEKALISCVDLECEQGYGSWKDFKYFLNHLKNELNYFPHKKNGVHSNHIFLDKVVKYIVKSLKNDEQAEHPSLLARWLPREKSAKFGWIAKFIANEYYSEWRAPVGSVSTCASDRKCLTHYRKLLSSLNYKLKTPQINQCNGTWGSIDFDKSMTSLTLTRQKNAFQYITKSGVSRGYDSDRVKCRENFADYIQKCAMGKTSIKGSVCDMAELVKEAMTISTNKNVPQATKDTVNLQWEKLGEKLGDLSNFIAMVDVSGSMSADNALYAAVGLGCRVAEKSKLGRRVMTFSANPNWVNLDNEKSLTEMVDKVRTSEWGMTTNFVYALRLVLRACVEKDIKPSEVSELVLAVFSDMQIDVADRNAKNMYNLIEKEFSEAGLKTSHKVPYPVPHILFWNLRSTSGFPTLSSTPNTSMLSGFSAVLLNSFCEKGMEALKDCTPWAIFLEQLENDRYKWAHNTIIDELTVKEDFEQLVKEDVKAPVAKKGWFW